MSKPKMKTSSCEHDWTKAVYVDRSKGFIEWCTKCGERKDDKSQTIWVSARKKLPENYRPYLCILRMNDQGEYAKWQMVLYYDFKRNVWCESDPSVCNKGEEKPITEWWSVICWKSLEWPENINDF